MHHVFIQQLQWLQPLPKNSLQLQPQIWFGVWIFPSALVTDFFVSLFAQHTIHTKAVCFLQNTQAYKTNKDIEGFQLFTNITKIIIKTLFSFPFFIQKFHTQKKLTPASTSRLRTQSCVDQARVGFVASVPIASSPPQPGWQYLHGPYLVPTM